jgi:hypothetical protein
MSRTRSSTASVEAERLKVLIIQVCKRLMKYEPDVQEVLQELLDRERDHDHA